MKPVSEPLNPGPATKPLFLLRVLAAVAGQFGALVLLLFLPAGTWNWWQAWVLIGLMAAFSGWCVLRLPRDLMEERMKPLVQEGQPAADRVLTILILTAFCGQFLLASLDFRLRLLPRPGLPLSSVGLVLFAAGSWILYLAARENAFAASVIRHQEERGQTVIDTGVYGIVRHPMYAGGVLLMFGTPLWLGSYAATLACAILILLLVLRIRVEEGLLQKELAGYDLYARRVRFRVLPGIW
jgi:protein-S-isoprenylcysteine O-methyltransferase Ste14